MKKLMILTLIGTLRLVAETATPSQSPAARDLTESERREIVGAWYQERRQLAGRLGPRVTELIRTFDNVSGTDLARGLENLNRDLRAESTPETLSPLSEYRTYLRTPVYQRWQRTVAQCCAESFDPAWRALEPIQQRLINIAYNSRETMANRVAAVRVLRTMVEAGHDLSSSLFLRSILGDSSRPGFVGPPSPIDQALADLWHMRRQDGARPLMRLPLQTNEPPRHEPKSR